MSLSVPGALSEGTSSTCSWATSSRRRRCSRSRPRRCVGRAMSSGSRWVYLPGAALDASVVVMRFDVGSGSGDWRLGHLHHHHRRRLRDVRRLRDAVRHRPPACATQRRHRPAARSRGAGGPDAGVRLLGSRGGFIALAAVTTYVVVRYHAIPLRWRISTTVLVAIVILATASGRYWDQMGTIASDADYNRTAETGGGRSGRAASVSTLDHPLLGVGPATSSGPRRCRPSLTVSSTVWACCGARRTTRSCRLARSWESRAWRCSSG